MTISAVQVSPTAVQFSGARSRLRITPRGRAVLAVIVAAPLAALALWFGLGSGAAGATSESGAGASSVTVEHVTVKQGESLWQIAEAIAPHDDPRSVVSAIVDFNGLQSSVVMPGQSLAVPPQFAPPTIGG